MGRRRAWLAGLMLWAFVAGLGVPAAGQDVADAGYQQFLFAYRLMQRGEDQAAIGAFDDYLGRFPNHAYRGDGLYFRAALARKTGHAETAARLLENVPATKVAPDYAVALLRGQVQVDLGRFDQAIASLEKIRLDALTPEVRAAVLLLRGQAYRGAGNLPAAVTQLEAAAQIESPLRPRALLELGRVQGLLDKPDPALAALEKNLATPDAQTNAEAARLAGDLAYRAGRYERAAGYYQVVLTQHQSSEHFAPSVVGLLWTQLAARQYEPLLATFRQYQASLPANQKIVANYLAASAQQELGRHDQAVAVLQEMLANPASATAPPGTAAGAIRDKVLYKLAVSQFELGQYDAMAQTLERLGREHPQSPLNADGQFLLAAADARRGDVNRGAARLTAIIDQGPRHPYHVQALRHRARLYESSNQPQPAAADYEKFLAAAGSANPPVPPATVQSAAVALMDLQLQLGRFDAAEALAGQLLAQGGLDPLMEQEAMYRRVLALVRQNKFDAALAAIDTLLQKHPQNQYLGAARYYRGLILVSQQKPDQALPDLQAAAQSTGLSPELRANALRLMALHQHQSGHLDAAAQTVLELEKLIGAGALRTGERLWLAQYYVGKTQAQTALRYLEPIISAKSDVPGAARAEALYLSGQALRALGDLAGAETALRRVVAEGHGFELRARLELAQILRETGKAEEALMEYAGLISAEPSRIAAQAIYDSGQIHRDTAQARRRASDVAGAQTHLLEAQKLFKRLVILYPFAQVSPLPELSYVNLVEIAVELHQPADAAAQVQEMVSHYPDSPYTAYAKAVLAMQQNKRGDAAYLLEKLSAQPLDPRLASRVQALRKTLQ